MKTLEELKDKWRGNLNGFLIESAWMIHDRDCGKADAALEYLFKERNKEKSLFIPVEKTKGKDIITGPVVCPHCCGVFSLDENYKLNHVTYEEKRS